MTNHILVITNDAADANTLKDVLGKARDGAFCIEWITTLTAGFERLMLGGIDAILVDLSLEGINCASVLEQLLAVAPLTPIITLSALEDEALTSDAARHGAQGHLPKGFLGSSLVPQMFYNIIRLKTLEDALHRDKTRAGITLNSIADAVICTDTSGNIDYMNPAAEKLTGWRKEDAYTRPIGEVFHIINGVTRKPECNTVELVLRQNKVMSLPPHTHLVRKDGSEAAIEDSASPIHDRDGQLAGAVIVFHDVSEAQEMSLKMAHLAQHDFLTDLPNRVLLNDRIERAITLAKRQQTQLAVLFLDLDNFKRINDSLGHANGDKLLQSVSQRLSSSVRDSDTVSRQGGDEFVILLAEGNNAGDAALTAEKILNMLSLPHSIAKRDLHVTTSIGISIYPADGTDADTLIRNADMAMYYAKERGRNNFQFFRNEMNIRVAQRQIIEANLRHALDKQEFILHYQPKVNLDTGLITGAEAVLRWIHADWGVTLPERFVPIAEECGLIVPIGRWVLREACMQAKRWIDAGLPFSSIAVNISAVEFRHKNFFEGVCAILKETGLEPQFLQLEITESTLMSDAEGSASILHDLKSMGIKLAVDDFGTGFSSLSYLTQFPIDILKIDKSFINGIGSSGDNGIIIGAVIGIGKSMKLKVIAEGVENQAQLKFLKERHCEEGQGNLFSYPVGAEKFPILLENNICEMMDN